MPRRWHYSIAEDIRRFVRYVVAVRKVGWLNLLRGRHGYFLSIRLDGAHQVVDARITVHDFANLVLYRQEGRIFRRVIGSGTYDLRRRFRVDPLILELRRNVPFSHRVTQLLQEFVVGCQSLVDFVVFFDYLIVSLDGIVKLLDDTLVPELGRGRFLVVRL